MIDVKVFFLLCPSSATFSPVCPSSFSFSALYSSNFGEQAQWAIYKDGSLVAQSSFTEQGAGSGAGTIDLSGFGPFNQIIFTGLPQTDGTDGSDFLITNVTFTNPASPAATYDDSLSGGDGDDAVFGGQGAEN